MIKPSQTLPLLCFLSVAYAPLSAWAQPLHSEEKHVSPKTPTSFSFGTSSVDVDFTEESVTEPEAGKKDSEDPYKAKIGGTAAVNIAFLLDHNARADVATRTKLQPKIEWQLTPIWSLKLSGDADYYGETGSNDYSEVRFDYNETYIRYSRPDYRITLGAQKIIWGSVDGPKPTDQLGGQNLRTYLTDDYEESRLATPALRAEYFTDSLKFDAVAVLELRETEIADPDSIYSFIDQDQGRFIGLTTTNPAMQPILQNYTVAEKDHGFGGGGLRISKTSPYGDIAVTAQRVRRTTPFYEVNPTLVNDVLSGTPVTTALSTLEGPTFIAQHPYMWVFGGDIAVPYDNIIFRAEGAWMSDVPVYNAVTLRRDTAPGFSAVAGVEFYPGDTDFRVIIQGLAQVIPGANGILDRNEIYGINGSLENEFAQGRITTSLDYFFGLDEHDIYLNPRLAYTGIDGHEFFGEIHFFEGGALTPGGYFQRNTQFLTGWKHDF